MIVTLGKLQRKRRKKPSLLKLNSLMAYIEEYNLLQLSVSD